MSYEKLHLDPDENVILEVRKHWIIFAGIAFGFICAAFLPFIIFTAIKIFASNYLNYDLPGNDNALFLFFYSLWLLTLWILFFVDWTKYYLDVWYVTEKRIIAIDQKNVFHREISNLRFDKIQDITVGIRGFISTLLDFGDVKVQTASEDSVEFTLNTVRHPNDVRKVIFGRQNLENEAEKGTKSNTQP